MRTFILLTGAALTLIGSGPALAKSSDGKPKVHKVCRTQGDSSSRIIQSRICRSKEEWDLIDEQHRQDAEDAQRNTNNMAAQATTARPD
ncbi:MAG: hypothetical protein ACJ8ER_05020 [Allosphingosinicella sp.]